MTDQQHPSSILDRAKAPKALIVFAHGAGADKSSDFMEHIAKALVGKECDVLRFNFPYMDKRVNDGKRRPPDRMPALIECFESVLSQAKHEGKPIFLLGKSMGSRVAASIANKHLSNVKGVIALGYPFHPQKKPEKLRLEPIFESIVPILIVQGSRDAFGSRDEISGYNLPAYCHVQFMEDGDHDLKPRVKSGFTHQQHKESAVNAIVGFIDEQCQN